MYYSKLFKYCNNKNLLTKFNKTYFNSFNSFNTSNNNIYLSKFNKTHFNSFNILNNNRYSLISKCKFSTYARCNYKNIRYTRYKYKNIRYTIPFSSKFYFCNNIKSDKNNNNQKNFLSEIQEILKTTTKQILTLDKFDSNFDDSQKVHYYIKSALTFVVWSGLVVFVIKYPLFTFILYIFIFEPAILLFLTIIIWVLLAFWWLNMNYLYWY